MEAYFINSLAGLRDLNSLGALSSKPGLKVLSLSTVNIVGYDSVNLGCSLNQGSLFVGPQYRYGTLIKRTLKGTLF